MIFLIAAKAFLPGPLLDPPDKIGYYHDEHSELYAEESARRSYVDDHQLPQWDPYYCGGVVGLGNAGSLVVAPDFILRIIYGTLSGKRLALLLFVLLGMEGTFRFARHNKSSAIGACVGAIAFSCGGMWGPMVGLGWGFMFNFNLIPWALLGFEKGLRQKRWMIVGGAAMAWILLGAGTYALPYTIFVLGLFAIYETARAIFIGKDGIKWWRPIATFVGIGVAGGLLSAIRLLPLLNLLASHERLVMQKDQTGPLSALAMMILPKEHANWGTGAGEYYIGTAVFGFALVAILFRDNRAAKYWAIGLLISIIACGEFIDNAPYLLVRKLPIYSQLRFPVRWLTVAGFFFVMAGIRGFTHVEDLLRRVLPMLWARLANWKTRLPAEIPPFPRALVNIAAMLVAGFIARAAVEDVIDHTAITQGVVYPLDAPQVSKQPFHQARGNRWDAEIFTFANVGTLHCFDENQLFESAYLRGDLKQEEYPAPESTGTTVERVSWTHHEIVLKVHAPENGGRFLVNQNHAPAWRTDVGTIGSDGGVISVRVPAGDHVVTLRYRDYRVLVGCLITGATILAIGFFAGKILRRRERVYRRWWRLIGTRNGDFPSPAACIDWLAGRPGAIAVSRNLVMTLLAVHLLAIGWDINFLKQMTQSLRHPPKPAVVPPPSGDTKFGVPLAVRKQVFMELATAEPSARAEGKRMFAGFDLEWSAEDHRNSFERRETAAVAGRHGLSSTQVYLILDEGIHEKWPGPDGEPLRATTVPLHPRRNYGF